MVFKISMILLVLATIIWLVGRKKWVDPILREYRETSALLLGYAMSFAIEQGVSASCKHSAQVEYDYAYRETIIIQDALKRIEKLEHPRFTKFFMTKNERTKLDKLRIQLDKAKKKMQTAGTRLKEFG